MCKNRIVGAVWTLGENVVVLSPGFSQAVPLVPLTEANEEAMEDKSFRKLLRKLGMRAPANEQVSDFFNLFTYLFFWYSSLPKYFT